MYAPGRRWRPQQEPANPSNNHFDFKKEYFIMKKVISMVRILIIIKELKILLVKTITSMISIH